MSLYQIAAAFLNWLNWPDTGRGGDQRDTDKADDKDDRRESEAHHSVVRHVKELLVSGTLGRQADLFGNHRHADSFQERVGRSPTQ